MRSWRRARRNGALRACVIRGHHGGVEKRGGWKTSRMTPLPKRGFGPPLVRYVFHLPQVSVLCFSCTKIHNAFSGTFSSPHAFCTPPYHGPMSGGVRVRFRVRFQAVKVPIFDGFQVENPTKQPPRSSSLRGMSLSEYGSEGFRARLRRLSEYGSVAYLVERPTWETPAEQYSDTVLVCSGFF